jgi:hypothetical protein
MSATSLCHWTTPEERHDDAYTLHLVDAVAFYALSVAAKVKEHHKEHMKQLFCPKSHPRGIAS